MQKIFIDLHTSSYNNFDANYNNSHNFNHSFSIDNSRLYFNSIDSLKKILADLPSFINYEKYIKKITEDVYITRRQCYIDSNGIIFEESDDINLDSNNYTLYERSDEELEKIIESEKALFDDYYKQIVSGEYSFQEFFVNRSMSFNDIKESINLVKDKIEYLNIDSLNINEITELINSVNISDNIKINTKYNYRDTCSKSELLELVDYLNNIKKIINRYNMSPLEICIFVNDLIREREYKKPDNKVDLLKGLNDSEKIDALMDDSESRSIMKVFKSDKIVCAGFSNLYSAILDLVGIEASTISYYPDDKKRDGHMSNIVYLNDEKYSVKGIFEIDTTWGRKNKEDKSYDYLASINNYYHFARPFNVALYFKKTSKLNPAEYDLELKLLQKNLDTIIKGKMIFPVSILIDTIKNAIDKCIKIDKKFDNRFLHGEIKALENYINLLKNNQRNITNDVVELCNQIKDKVYKSNFDLKSFAKALYRVKFIEHSIDKDKYPFDINELKDACNTRVDDSYMKLLFEILLENEIYAFDEEKKLDLARAEFISALHKIAKVDVDKNPTMHI